MGLDYQASFGLGDGCEIGYSHTEHILGVGKYVVLPSVEEVIVLALIETELRSFKHFDPLFFAFFLKTFVPVQERVYPVA